MTVPQLYDVDDTYLGEPVGAPDSRLDQERDDTHQHFVEPGSTLSATCAVCGTAFSARRKTATYCTTTCRSRAYRNSQLVTRPEPRAQRARPANPRLSVVREPQHVVDPLLFIHVTTLNGIEKQRVAAEHRLRILTRSELDSDGLDRGFGLDESHPAVARVAALAEVLASLEHDAVLDLRRALRRCALHPWIKAQVGLGEKQSARLLGLIGDPYWHLVHDRTRTVGELWAYCGFKPGQFLQQGVQANWSTEAGHRARLMAESCVRQAHSPYRVTYDARREHTAVTHPEWTPGHSHNDALRIASKAILRDLWREAKRLHEGDA